MPILYELKEHVAHVTIDRPEVMNAIDAASERELQKIWSDIESNRDVRCVVLTGGGERAFSTGADMKGGSGASGLEYWALPRTGGFGGIALRETLDVPVIARVNGHAVGGGFEMVLGCDIIVAAEEATFGLPEARVGRLPLDGGMTLLQRQVPFHLAMGLMLTGKRIPAAEALRIGLVNEVAPRAELDAAVARWVDDILACAPLSVRAIKQVVRRTAQLSAAEGRGQLLPALAEALQSEDSREGVRAFIEKRKPVWQGK
jgi:crotonobetainyl-CoA hydratase